jgi:predicted negative regulator of RcsB-dependent stress response
MAKRLKVSRKDLFKEPDQFLSASEKVMLFFMANRFTVIFTIAGILIAGSSFFGFKYYQETSTLKDEALYYQIEKTINNNDNSTSETKAILEKMGDGPQKNRASLLIADSHFQRQEYDKAEGTYLMVMSSSSPKNINYQMAQVGLAYSYLSRTDYKKAIGIFKSVIDSNTSFPLFEIYFALSKCHELNEDISKALLVLREMQIKFSENPQVERVKSHIKKLSI